MHENPGTNHALTFRLNAKTKSRANYTLYGKRKLVTYNKFNDINGGSIGTESRDTKIETAGKELFGFFLAVEREIRVHTSPTMHGNCPTPHFLSFFLLFFPLLCSWVCETAMRFMLFL